MCKPIAGNTVRLKATQNVELVKGSTGVFAGQKSVMLPKDAKGVAEGPARGFRDFFIILFGYDDEIVRTRLHHTEIKGVEQHA